MFNVVFSLAPPKAAIFVLYCVSIYLTTCFFTCLPKQTENRKFLKQDRDSSFTEPCKVLRNQCNQFFIYVYDFIRVYEGSN